MNRATNRDRSGASPARGGIPRGIEVLVKKASVDDEFRKLLLEKRAEAAAEIGLELDPAEVAMLNGIPAEQLEAIIGSTSVRPEHRATFSGRNAVLMLGVLAAGALLVAGSLGTTAGVRVDLPPWPGNLEEVAPPLVPEAPDELETAVEEPAKETDEEEPPPVSRGIRPDRPLTKGIRPDRPPARTDDDTSNGEEE